MPQKNRGKAHHDIEGRMRLPGGAPHQTEQQTLLSRSRIQVNRYITDKRGVFIHDNHMSAAISFRLKSHCLV